MVVELGVAIPSGLCSQACRAPVRSDVVRNAAVNGLTQQLTIHRVRAHEVTRAHLVHTPAFVLEVYLYSWSS